MKPLIAAALLAAVTASTGTVFAASDIDENSATARAEAETFLTAQDCPTNVGEALSCASHRNRWLRIYQAARAGSVEAQRRVAMMFESLEGGAVRIDRVQACAWHLFIAVEQKKTSGDTDTVWLAGCDKLSAAERAMAIVRSRQIDKDIHERPARMPTFPTTEDNSHAARAEAEEFLRERDCRHSSLRYCELYRARWLHTYQAARANVIEAQRHVAALFRASPGETVRIDAVQECAWRLFIATERQDVADAIDVLTSNIVCGRLSAADHAAAAARSQQIAKDIRERPARIPPPQPSLAEERRRG